MEYQKIINLLDSLQNEPSTFRTRNWVEINNKLQGTYNASNQIEFKTAVIRSSLCDYSNAYILVSGTMTIKENEQMIIQNDWMKEIKEQYLKILRHLLSV